MDRKEVLGIILARGGSKSIHKKSIAPCAGHPLLYYTIKAAQNAPSITRLIVSTDDEEMAEVARNEGVEVPFMRPPHLAEDTTPDFPVIEHALNELAKDGYTPDAVVHLRPTTPLKKATDIESGIRLLFEYPDADSVRSVCEPNHTPFKMCRTSEDSPYLQPLLTKEYPEVFAEFPEAFNMPRQALPAVWRHSGYVDVIRTSTILEKGSMSGTNILPLHFEKWRDIDIDTPMELTLAEIVINELRKDGKEPWE